MPRAARPPWTLRVSLGVALVVAPVACGRVGYEIWPDLGATGGTSGREDASVGAGGASGGASTGGASTGGAGARSADASASGGSGGAHGVPESGVIRDAAVDGADAGARGDGAPDAAECRPTGAPPDYCAAVRSLPRQPVIDGALDCGLSLRTLVPAGWNGTEPMPADVSAEYAVAFRPDGLYFYVEVTDPSRVPARAGDEAWRGDGVELYVDADGVFASPPAYDNPGTRQIQIVAPVDARIASTRAELFTPGVSSSRAAWTASAFVAVPTPAGYAVEAFVGATELGVSSCTLAAGSVVGMDVGINVSDATDSTYEAKDGYRLGQYFLRITGTGDPGPFNNATAFCTPTLGD